MLFENVAGPLVPVVVKFIFAGSVLIASSATKPFTYCAAVPAPLTAITPVLVTGELETVKAEGIDTPTLCTAVLKYCGMFNVPVVLLN